ncbi:AAA family ATPase [Desulfuromonas carbonis]|uniref:AAA family ATPase n=1 Tax=Desulfuromonas sp. DDH964 TaxID=1823759 RepID=UPI00078E11AC|nr:AAA family ATPase [Desulfuromonas sp. DDH964]AMV72835.1 MoxR family ATPase [Desulfuromonas sp. DDH964]
MPIPTPSQQVTDKERDITRLSAFVEPLFHEMGKQIVGQRELVEALLIGLLSSGHVLIEGLPGLAKTRTVKTLASALALDSGRIQFTPDLLPSDLLGAPVYHPGSGAFSVRRGPIFTHLLLADEINRAPAKVQSALLEAMEEQQVTIGDESLPLPEPFLVLATQNPLDHEGTYPLPEAQLDRFMLKALVGYPSRREEEEILATIEEASCRPVLPVLAAAELAAARAAVREIFLAPSLRGYILDLVAATRNPATSGLAELAPFLEHGVSPRGAIFLARAARAHAFLAHRSYVVPDDILKVLPLVFRHRLVLSFQAVAEGVDADQLLERVACHIPPP